MNPIERRVRKLDHFQRRHPLVAFPFAVIQKFGNDQGGAKAALIAYYGFFSLFPLLLLLTTILGFVLAGDPDLQHRIINSALGNFPIIGTQLRSSVHPLRGNLFALAFGILGTIYGGLGVGKAAENAMNSVWNVPFKDWSNLVFRTLRGVTILVVLAGGTVVSTALASFGSDFLHGPYVRVWVTAASVLVNLGVFFLAFRVLTYERVSWRDVALGAVLATVFWEILQGLGGWYVHHVVSHANNVYGFFAVVIGLLSWIYMGAQLILLAAEINVVRRYHLWPRSVTQPPFTPEDKETYVRLAMMEERRPEVKISVRFTPEADRRPLEAAGGP